MNVKRIFSFFLLLVVLPGLRGAPVWAAVAAEPVAAPDADDPTAPAQTVKLIFLHHSTGRNWLADDDGGLGLALRNNNYFVSDTNYNWGPDGIGSTTDIGDWWTWFRGPKSSTYMQAVYTEFDRWSTSYSRLASDPDPSRENQIVLFKSCFPNSRLRGNPTDPATSGDNPLRGQDSSSQYHTVANAKGIYNDLLVYFAAHQDKLFVVITAPPLVSASTTTAQAANARAFNNWLVNDWLDNYAYKNVAVYDFYNVLTSNGGSSTTNDLGQATGNHHRWYNGALQHVQGVDNNLASYPTSDSHPSQAGNLKATGEFVQVLNVFYHRWVNSSQPVVIGDVKRYLPLVHQDR